MKRNILLVEPAFNSKFPPLGLMKISSYHKDLDDNVSFVRGIDDKVAYSYYWDRIYVSTVFTYNWDITVKTIKYYKEVVKNDISRILVGGILATLMPEDLWKETGVLPTVGLLNKPKMLDEGSNRIVDKMIPDYSLFDSIDYKYKLIDDSYFGYTTRGCPNKCNFCGVRLLEPKFIDYRGIKKYINSIKSKYGEKRDLVLFDNNVLASKSFEKIIDDIVELGFGKNEKLNNRARHVDFNQGIDARLLSDNHMKQLSRIALHPLRIAFDNIKYKGVYTDSIGLAAKYEIINLSNYILYNHENDTPEELWERLKINIELNKKFDLRIYSFPMKYIPLKNKNRNFTAKSWNWQYIRGVQRILNVVKGIVMPGEDFFHRAFGNDTKEFIEILHMPERILMNRTKEPQKEELNWLSEFRSLSDHEKEELLEVLCLNKRKKELSEAVTSQKNHKIKSILEYYIE